MAEEELEILAGLNRAQREAVTETEGYVRVLAGAGSGKTRALSQRFAYLVNEIGIMPGNILCVTFTNKSATEMRKRIHLLTGDNDTGYINTFHGFCVSVLQEDSYAVQYPKSFLVLDNSDIDAMLKIIYEERHLSLRDMTFAKARDMIEIRKIFTEPKYYEDMIALSLDGIKEKYDRAVEPADIIFYGYLYQEKKCFGLDYNDLIKFTLYIFEQKEELRLKWQQRLEYIMIDEFQDIDELQYRLMKILCGYHKNLFVVGDPDQTIYTWRGANIRYLLDFDQEFSPAKTIYMMENYRSTPEILAVANDLIAHNRNRIEKNLRPVLPAGQSVLCASNDSPEEEAKWIAQEIAKLHEQGVPYRQMAVLYRAHYLSRPLEEVFLRAELPYTLYSGIHFFDRKEIKDALSYLRLIAYRDDLSFLRVANVPKRNLGERRMAFLQEYAAQNGCSLYEALRQSLDQELFQRTKAKALVELVEEFSASYSGRPVSEVLAALLDASGYEAMLRTEGSQERLDNLAELKQAIYEYETSCGEEAMLEDYLSRVALLTNSDTAETGDKVKLMTVHAAKGLEFPYVFLCGLNEGIFPSRKTRTQPAMEEERRLAFVAVTRAQKRLYLSAASGLNFDASLRYPSRFLLELDDGLLEYAQPVPALTRQDAQAYIRDMDRRMAAANAPKKAAFAKGDRVLHRIMGDGEILAVNTDKGAYVIKFADIDTPREISFKAKLEKIL
ncbi:DNA helicase-2 / ATP-dependent DNA helicase PcrA [Selenomonas ruminantium]|uniref:DNA 3'-5' helicase n=1 Tax=Selenomonas ruminantium TaxID=971 RepID=A0A1I3D0T7_SELRU|nr:UvrD-helicase domain-containing protein [Selenomonas ruminantium]SFH80246.1 DNA helicase-2 / ATP-dependent DNA helicase PcrA [Selenomonas ruminantium]